MNEDVKLDLMLLFDDFSENLSEEKTVASMAKAVQYLTEHDFPKLVEVLYRIDIDEKILKSKLAESAPAKSSTIIAQMIFDRQKQKILFKKTHKVSPEDISDEDKW